MSTNVPAWILIAGLLAGPLSAQEPPNLFPEGNFEILNAGGELETWTTPHPSYLEKIGGTIVREAEGEGHFMRLTLKNLQHSCHLAADLALPEDARQIKITYRVRTASIVAAQEPGWSGVLLGGAFMDAEGKNLSTLTNSRRQKTDQPEWIEIEEIHQVPAGAVKIRLQPGLYFTTGTADFDDFKVVVVPPETLARRAGPAIQGS